MLLSNKIVETLTPIQITPDVFDNDEIYIRTIYFLGLCIYRNSYTKKINMHQDTTSKPVVLNKRNKIGFKEAPAATSET